MLRPGHVVLVDEVLQLAVAVDLALHALVGVVAEQDLEHEAARVAGILALGVDDHALEHRRRAGRLQPACLLDRDDAHAAGAHVAQVGMVAEGGDVDAGQPGCLQNGAAVGRRDLAAY